MEKENKKSIIVNILIAAVCVGLVALLGNLFTNRNSEWYTALTLPSEWVPALVFPIVWSLIYFIFACIIFVLLQKNEMNKNLIILFAVNGVLNVLWCLTFFTLNSLIGGVIILVMCFWASVMLTMSLMKVDKKIGYISKIYPLWLTIALILNIASWILN